MIKKMMYNSLEDDSFVNDYYESDNKLIPYKTIMNSSSDRTMFFQQLDMFSQGFHTMEELWRNKILCDVTLKAELKTVSCHRIVLASTIPYFKAMFSHDMIECKQESIEIRGIDAVALELLINFAYTGRIEINSHNVQSLMLGSSFLQLFGVRKACEEFLEKRFASHNVIGVRLFADSLGCTKLVEAADKYIQKFFREVAASEEYLSLSFANLVDLVKKDELHVSSEEEVFQAVMKWIRNDTDARVVHLPELLSYVRLPLLTPQYLADYVSSEQLIRSSHECRDLVDEARDYHLMPERRQLLPSFKIHPRCCSHIIGHIFAVGGMTKSGDSLSTVEVFDPVIDRWQMAEAMSMLRSRVGVAVLKNRLYAVGGYNGFERLSTVEVFDPIKCSWSEVAPMRYNRSAVGAAALNDKLFVCGGYDGISSLNSVECYYPDKNKWVILTSMQRHRSAGGVVSFEGYIYVLGGHDGLSIFESVERYDPNTGIWQSITPMLTKRCRLGVATLNGKIYACGGYDGAKFLQTVEMYDPLLDKWQYVANMNVMRSRVSLVSNMGKLWAVGGYDGVSNLTTVEIYDPSVDSWKFVAPMCAHEGGVGAGVIPISYSE